MHESIIKALAICVAPLGTAIVLPLQAPGARWSSNQVAVDQVLSG